MLKGSSILVATLYLPLFVHTTKSHTTKGKVIFNLNNYRNMFHTKSNNAKKEMKQLIANMKVPHLGSGPFELEYTYYHGNRRVMDVSNAVSVIDKFTCDAITELALWPDDNYHHVTKVTAIWGGVDPGNGRCELRIYKI